MKKAFFILFFLLILAFFSGCGITNDKGNYQDFVRRSSSAGNSNVQYNNFLQIYSIYPSEISQNGLEKIVIYGNGFERETKVFIDQPNMKIEAFVFNPGYLEAWMPAHYPGKFMIGAINPDNEIAYWSQLITYKE